VHGDPASPKIALRVFVSEADFRHKDEPIVYLTGGPGGSVGGIAEVAGSKTLAEAFSRDVVLLEQRGTALSRPALDCKLDTPDKTEEELLRECVATYKADAIRLEAFNTLESAHDVEDLRVALGKRRLMLWGASYGSLLAAAVAREHPDSVAGLILEASVLGDRTYRSFETEALFPSKVTAFSAWLKSACAANSRCAASYPGLDPDAEMATMRERAKAAPVVIGDGIVIDSPAAVENLLFRAMYYAPHAVLLLRAIWASNHDKLAELELVTIDAQPALAYLATALDISASIASTTKSVVNCYDLIRSWTDEGVAKATAGTVRSDEERAELAQELTEIRGFCNALPPPTIDQARFAAPVSSDIPTVFVGSRLDPATPIEWAQEDSARFPRSKVIVSECSGHGVIFGALSCFSSMLHGFLRSTDTFTSATPIDERCLVARCAVESIDDDLFLENSTR
jgi:pimeloyl-ACP methyl ester carboxylesterase